MPLLATKGREETLAALKQQAEALRGQMEQIQQAMQQLERGEGGRTVARIDAEECAGCGSCVDACPQGAIELQDGVAVVDENACDGCGVCAGECPNEAITLV